jgi:anti-anti-sigma factor
MDGYRIEPIMNQTLKIMKEPAEKKEHVIILHLNGSLDANGEEVLLAIARQAYDEGARFILLDLAQVDILTSAGMRAMHKVYKMYTPESDKLKTQSIKLCNAPQQLYQALGITGFLLTIPIYTTIQEALDAFS